MLKNLSKILFMFMMLMGTFIAMSSNSWLGLWAGLEINLLAFIPLMMNKNNLNNSEAALNYFLVQAFASIIILFSLILLIMKNISSFSLINYLPSQLIILALMIKLGSPPFHFWFPNVMDNISWNSSLILMTWQKLAPMMIFSYLIKLNSMIFLLIFSAALVGAVGGLNQTSLRKLIAFSSINHLSWMYIALTYNEMMWMMYFLTYSFMSFCIIYLFKIFQVFFLNQVYSFCINSSMLKFSLLISMLSLGGLPPFIGFAPKWLIIQSMALMGMNFMNLFMICMSLITLFYYLKISFAAFMFNYYEFSFFFKNFFSMSWLFTMSMMNFISIMGFFLIMELIYLT